LNNQDKQQDVSVGIVGYLALLFAIVFFSGILKNAPGIWKALDFTVLLGKFGTVAETTFRGASGVGARDGFVFAFTLFPAVMLAIGVVAVVEHLGGLKAAHKLLNPLLRPLLGIPGICTLALVGSLQSTDAGAAMTRDLRESGVLNEKEKTIFAAFQFSFGAPIVNYFSSGVALFPMLVVPIGLPLLVGLVFKVIGANIMRLYLRRFDVDLSAAE